MAARLPACRLPACVVPPRRLHRHDGQKAAIHVSQVAYCSHKSTGVTSLASCAASLLTKRLGPRTSRSSPEGADIHTIAGGSLSWLKWPDGPGCFTHPVVLGAACRPGGGPRLPAEAAG